MDACLNAFITELNTQHYSSHSVSNYQRDIVAFQAWRSESAQIDMSKSQSFWQQQTLHDLEAYVMALSEENKHPRTIRRQLSALRRFYRFMLQQGCGKIPQLPVFGEKTFLRQKLGDSCRLRIISQRHCERTHGRG